MDDRLIPDELKRKRAMADAPKTKSVAKGKVKKQSTKDKFAEVFTAENWATVKDYIFYDCIIPTIVDGFVDTVEGSIDMLFYGRVRSRGRRGGGGWRRASSNRDWEPQFSYDRVDRWGDSRGYGNGRDRDRDRYSQRRQSNRLDTILLETRGDAENVLEELAACLDTYGRVSVAAYYEACGVTSNRQYTDENWGWTTLRNARVVRDRDGYFVDLPKPEPID